MSVWAGTKISKVHRLHTPSSATCPGAAPVADLANLGPRLCFAGPQRRSTAATDWPGVRPISPARRPIPMSIPTRDPVPLVRRADHAWLAPTSCIGHDATFRHMAREPARATNAGGPAARDECVPVTSASADVPPDRLQSPPRRRATAVAAESIGTPCRPCCWSHVERGAAARPAGARVGAAPDSRPQRALSALLIDEDQANPLVCQFLTCTCCYERDQ